jgi:hypothetical protein
MSLASLAVASAIFVHLKHPATHQPMYVQKEVANKDTEQPELVDDLDKPIGLRMYTPGSKQYRKAEAAQMSAMVANKGKALTGEQIFANQTELLAQTTYEFVNFDEFGPCTVENARRLFADEEYVAVREQAIAAQNDLGNASTARSKN